VLEEEDEEEEDCGDGSSYPTFDDVELYWIVRVRFLFHRQGVVFESAISPVSMMFWY